MLGPDDERGPVYADMFGIWYLGKLTKLYAYGFQYMFQVLLVSAGTARDVCKEQTIRFQIL